MKGMVRFGWAVLALTLGVGCGNGGPSKSTLERYCAFDQSCGHPVFQSAGQCVYAAEAFLAQGPEFANEYNRVIGCADSSSTCDQMQLCVSRDHGPSYCSMHSGKSCDGTILVDCGGIFSSGYGSTINCTDYNSTCITANGSAACATSTTCTSASNNRCEGTHAINCDGDTQHEVDLDCTLAYPSGTCGVMNGVAQCLRNAPSCSASAPHCDGNTLVQCGQDNKETRVDCASAVEGSCRIVGGNAQCVSDANECGSSDDDRCMGDNLQLCVNGRYETLACSSVGYPHCTVRSGFGAHGVQCTN